MKRLFLPAALAALACGGAAAAPPAAPPDKGPLAELLRRANDAEFVQMFAAVLRGSRMGPGEGWFKPARKRHDWEWLAARADKDGDGTIGAEEFGDRAELLKRLDRDGSGGVTAEDFDWSPESPYVRQLYEARQLLARIDGDDDGELSAEEWKALFEKHAGDEGRLTAEGVRRLLNPPKPKGPPPDRPSPATLISGLLNGELGSPLEGPDVGEPAPNFRLPRHDGKGEISLAQFRYSRPVVLIFGSFT